MYDCFLAPHSAFQQPHFRWDLGSGVIFGSDKNLEILVGYRVFKLAFEFIVYLQHSSILRIFSPSLGSPPRNPVAKECERRVLLSDIPLP
jgi:hypothetical protein